MLIPCTTGRSACRWCGVDTALTKFGLCAHCEAGAICWKCGVKLEEYRPDEQCDACYQGHRWRFNLVRKDWQHDKRACIS